MEARPEFTPAPAGAASSRITVASVFGRTFGILRHNPGLFFGLTLAMMLPIAVISGLLPENVSMIANPLLASIFGMVLQGTVAYGAFQSFRGGKPGIGDALARGFARFLPLFATAVLLGLGIGIGMMALLVPGLILLCLWAVAIPVCVVERKGPIDSMKRSAELTKGFRWQIFALYLITGITIALVNGALTFVLVQVLKSDSMVVVFAATSLLVAIPQTVQYAMTAVIYYDLRAEKEGVSIDNLANVFD